MRIQDGIPERQGLSSKALLDFFNQMERAGLDVNSFMLLKDGKSVVRFWRRPYREDCPQLLFSLSKSFTSIAIGIAWDEGFLKLEDTVISFFPDKLPEHVSSNLASMTVHHLLSMNTGHRENIYAPVVKEKDWVKAFLSLDVEHAPGSHYRYSTPATYMLAAILEKATGENMVDFLMPRLFEPLGMPRPSWETCPMGVTAGGMGLSIPTEGIAKFGQMLLDKGMYGDRRIVSERYIDLALKEQSDNRQGEERIDFAQGYGYQFFMCRRGCYMGNGGFGQLCFVAPRERIVIAATSAFGSMKQLQTLLDLIFEYIFDRAAGENLPGLADYHRLQNHLAALTHPVPKLHPKVPEAMPDLNERCYIMEENPHDLAKVCFRFKQDKLELRMAYEDGTEKRLPFDLKEPVHTEDKFVKDLELHRQEVVAYANWQDPDTLKLNLLYIETPYAVTYTVQFRDDRIEFQFQINVSLTLKGFTAAGKIA
ncbi:serine hydrolase domain-containing protein [Paenibacillus contaminans]|nr:serine hydrolase [Paenibacillus contaminans]